MNVCAGFMILGYFLSFCHVSSAQCQADSYDQKLFGNNCQYLCHCKAGAECDGTTGDCSNGCENGWMGPACQYRNVALDMHSRHLDNTGRGLWASRANDDDVTTCSETNIASAGSSRTLAPLWRVYFGRTEVIRGIVLSPRSTNLNDFVGGFKITVENITDAYKNTNGYYPTESELCYQHEANKQLNSTFEVYCGEDLIGNQVRIQLSSKFTQLALCDVKIYGGRNVAFKKPTSQSSTSRDSALAVDGNIKTSDVADCSMTNYEYQPWQKLNLERMFVVYSVTLYVDSDDSIRYNSLEGQSVINGGWVKIHVDSRFTPTRQISMFENLIAIRLRRQYSDFLSICELQVFGDCPANLCGLNCEIACYCKDFKNFQDKVSGTCITGCVGRWTGLNYRCDTECSDDEWGTNCENTCGYCNTPCNVHDGFCTDGCRPGYLGQNCTQECADGRYGLNCSDECYANCKGGMSKCNHIDGQCKDGCSDGYQNDRCDSKCHFGYFGEVCSKQCSINCMTSSKCNHITGTCDNGCRPGWKGDRCDTECDDGRFGANCSNVCSDNCEGGVIRCSHIDGHCENGCSAGYYTLPCNEECPDGKWGNNCQMDCTTHCEGGLAHCNHKDGHCEQGCDAGWTLSNCTNECMDGQWGKNCVHSCGHCQEQPCNRTTGVCYGSCKPGFKKSIKCEEECDDMSWGYDCNTTCGSCLSQPCHKVTGQCNDACLPGYLQTDHCTTECSDGFYGTNCSEKCGGCRDISVCNKSSGLCLQGCADGFTGDGCTQRLTGDITSVPIAGIAGGIIGALFIIGIVVVVMIFIRRRQSNIKKTFDSNASTDTLNKHSSKGDNIYQNSEAFVGVRVVDAHKKEVTADNQKTGPEEATEEDGQANENLYYNNMTDMVPRSAIYLSDLREYIIIHRSTNKFVEEFKSVPYGLQYPATAALKPVNRSKNRYKDMYPYDHSRVTLNTLPGKPDSDYINACYVDGYNKKQEFIAAQGPVDNNIADFWRMIWEKNIKTIVMLTNATEKGKMKCIEYWKDAQYELISVHMVSEEILAEMTIRHLEMKQNSEAKGKPVTQFHFTAWPDKSTPQGATGLVQFLHNTRKHWKGSDKPIVVHCSAGVGRTGTFMAMDILYEQGKELNYVDILGVTQKLRAQRVNAVQTKGQYAFLHEAAYEMLLLPGLIDTTKFSTEYSQMLEVDKTSKQVLLLDQFKNIQEVLITEKLRNGFNDIRDDDDAYSEAKKSENKDRNRYANILAANRFRPFLSTPVEGCNSYINAVYVQGIRDPYSYLLSQAPMTTTAVDYCRLIVERSVLCIVTFDWSTLEQQEKYLPERKTNMTIGPFKITNVTEKKESGYIVRDHTLEYKGTNYAVQQFVYTDWGVQQPLPTNLATFNSFLEEMQSVRKKTEGTILVQCLNGADKSGLFVVLMNVIEKMKAEGNVAISQVIRQIRQRREQIIPVYDQYRFCHDLIQCHLEENSVYANV